MRKRTLPTNGVCCAQDGQRKKPQKTGKGLRGGKETSKYTKYTKRALRAGLPEILETTEKGLSVWRNNTINTRRCVELFVTRGLRPRKANASAKHVKGCRWGVAEPWLWVLGSKFRGRCAQDCRFGGLLLWRRCDWVGLCGILRL